MWDELHGHLKTKGIKIRSIWIADVSHQGESGVLNEHKLGNDRTLAITTTRLPSNLRY